METKIFKFTGSLKDWDKKKIEELIDDWLKKHPKVKLFSQEEERDVYISADGEEEISVIVKFLYEEVNDRITQSHMGGKISPKKSRRTNSGEQKATS